MPKQYPRTRTRSAIVVRSRRLILALVLGTVVHLIVAWAPIVYRYFVEPELPMVEPNPTDAELAIWSQDRVWVSSWFASNQGEPISCTTYEWADRSWASFTAGWYVVSAERHGWPWRSLQSGTLSDIRHSIGGRRFGSIRIGRFLLPWHPRPISFLGNTIVYTSATYALLALTGALWHRRHRNRCRHCGHHLLAEQTTCPECGRGARGVTSPV